MDSVLGGRASEAKDEDLRLCLSSVILQLQDGTVVGLVVRVLVSLSLKSRL